MSPDAFEAAMKERVGQAARMSFLRHEEIYPNDDQLEDAGDLSDPRPITGVSLG